MATTRCALPPGGWPIFGVSLWSSTYWADSVSITSSSNTIIRMLHSVDFTETLLFGTVPPVFLCFVLTYYIMYQRGNALIWRTLDKLVVENCDAFMWEHKAKYRLTLTQNPLKLMANVGQIVRIVLSQQTVHSMKRKYTLSHFSALSQANQLSIFQVWFFIELTVQCLFVSGSII